MSVQIIIGVVLGLLALEGISLMSRRKQVLKNIDISIFPLRVMLLGLLLGVSIFILIEEKNLEPEENLEVIPDFLTVEAYREEMSSYDMKMTELLQLLEKHQETSNERYHVLMEEVLSASISHEELKEAFSVLESENLQLKEALASIEEKGVASNRQEQKSNSEAVLVKTYTDGVYQGVGQGFNGPTTVEVTIKDDQIISVTIVDYIDDLSWFNRAKRGLLGPIIEQQSADLDVISGATYSSEGILEAVKNALLKAKGE